LSQPTTAPHPRPLLGLNRISNYFRDAQEYFIPRFPLETLLPIVIVPEHLGRHGTGVANLQPPPVEPACLALLHGVMVLQLFAIPTIGQKEIPVTKTNSTQHARS